MGSYQQFAAPHAGAGKIPYRLFWDWDHCTTWCLNVPGSQYSGVANAYTKEGKYFELDYRRMVDWCAANGMDAIGIVGILRDRHGGVDSVRRLCSYAMEKGVRIYMIAGLYAYNGIYYEGDHPYTLESFFAKNPDAIGRDKDGNPLLIEFKGKWGHKKELQGCPSNPKLREFVLESLDWAFREIPELGGIQMEAGDCGVCQCDLCRERRGAKAVKDYKSFEDMAGIYPQAADVVWKRNPEAWVICETYHHFLDEASQLLKTEHPSPDLQRLFDMPEKTFFQWKCDRELDADSWQEGAELPDSMKKFRHIMRAHSGTQWWGGRHTFAADRIRRQCRLSYESGLQAVSMFGESSPFHTNAEFNYLALTYFADHPLSDMEHYAEDIMAPRLGGMNAAECYLKYAPLTAEPEKIPGAVEEIAKIAAKVGDLDSIRRWNWLSTFLSSYYWEYRHQDDTAQEFHLD